jgi:hypothetical protein
MTTQPNGSNAGSHPHHDRLLIAAHAARDLAGRDLERAEALLATCDACRRLELELRAIAAATKAVPPPARLAGRDFRISADRAAALSRGRWWRTILRPFGRPTGSAVRPLALTLTTLGFAGLILASLPSFPLGGTGAAPAGAPGGASRSSETPSMLAGAPLAGGSQSPAPSPVPEAYSPRDASGLETEVPTTYGFGAASGDVDTSSGGVPVGAGQGGGQPLPSPPADNAKGESSAALEGEPAGPPPLVLLSVGLLGAGLGLLLLHFAALRLR